MSIFELTASAVTALEIVLAGPVGPFDMPPAEEALTGGPGRFSHEIVYADGSPAGRTAGNRSGPVTLEELPEIYVQAIVATEDANFYQHLGVDPVAIGRVLADGVVSGEVSAGASTITQQLIKNVLIGSDRTFDRKIREMLLAVALEEAASKPEILEAYLNVVYFGRGVWGVGDAAERWFGRPIDALDHSEIAFLAGVIQAPASLDPLRSPNRAVGRRDHVLARLLEEGYITEEEHAAAVATPLEVVQPEAAQPSASWIAHHVESAFRRRLDIEVEEPLRVTTTIRPELQEMLEGLLAEHLSRLGGDRPWPLVSTNLADGLDATDWTAAERAVYLLPPDSELAIVTETTQQGVTIAFADGRREALDPEGQDWNEGTIRSSLEPGDVILLREGHLESVPPFQGAALVMEAASGRVLALSGGFDPWLSAFDRTLARRQPGSAIKPFLYLSALQEGLQYDQLVLDRPIAIPQANGEIWTPGNYTVGEYSGAVPAYRALERSLNVVAARLVVDYGLEPFAAVTEGANIYERMPRDMAAGLGAIETTLLDLAGGYAMFANGGYPVMATAIAAVENQDGDVLWQMRPPSPFPLADPETIRVMDSMLRGVVVRGTAASAFAGHSIAIAGKTGTSQDGRDTWFVGFTPDTVVAVWIGRDNNTSLGRRATGGRLAAPLAARIFGELGARGLIDRQAPWQPLEARPHMMAAPPVPAAQGPAMGPVLGSGTGGLY